MNRHRESTALPISPVLCHHTIGWATFPAVWSPSCLLPVWGQGTPEGCAGQKVASPPGQPWGTPVFDLAGNSVEQQDKNPREGDHPSPQPGGTSKGDTKGLRSRCCLRGILEGSCAAHPGSQLPAP